MIGVTKVFSMVEINHLCGADFGGSLTIERKYLFSVSINPVP
jgi:hypothetical protein